MKLIHYLAISTAVTLGLASCTSETYNLNDIDSNGTKVFNYKPLRPSEINLYSNGIKLDNFYKISRATSDVVTWEFCQTYIDRESEKNFIEETLKEENNNTDLLNTDFLYYADEDLELEFYPVVAQTSYSPNFLGIFYYDQNGNKIEKLIWEELNPSELLDYQTFPNESKGVKVQIKKGYKFGFYWGGIYAYKTEDFNYTKTIYYTTAEYNEEVYSTDGAGNRQETKSKIHAGTFSSDGKTYLCLEDWTDFDYQDLVFTCNKVLTTVNSDDRLPEEPNDEPNNGKTPSNPGSPQIPDDPSVEVNFELNDEHEKGDWIESHLSVHVRDTVDFEIYIPIKAVYYCEPDDMMIVQKHDESFVYNKSTQEISMEIAGTTVTLTINYDENGITIRSKGINSDVLKECREKYGDGLTFEIRNYYNDVLTREGLKEMLSKATITFYDENGKVTYTGLYINSFGQETEDGKLTLTVTPADEENWNEKKGEHENTYTPKSAE